MQVATIEGRPWLSEGRVQQPEVANASGTAGLLNHQLMKSNDFT